MSEKPRYFIGVKKNPDGTLDYSKAARWDGPKKEQPVKPLSAEDLMRRKEELDEMWRTSQETKRKRAEAERARTSEQAESAYKQLGVESPSEREESRERAVALVLQDGGISIHMSVMSSLSQNGSSGFQNLETRIRGNPSVEHIKAQLVSRDDVMRNERLDDVMKGHGFKEIIDIRHEIKPVYETVTTPGRKGILGIGKTPDQTVSRFTGRYGPIMHSERVSDGKREPAVRFTYYIPQTEWRDYSGRPGQAMSVEIILPQSVAREVEQTLERDPAAMRTIVERVMKERLLKDPKAWETPQGNGDSLRPPYERWDAQPGGGRIYVQKEGVEPGFHNDALKKAQR